MKDLLIQIVKALVDNPEQVQINEIEGSQTVVLELREEYRGRPLDYWLATDNENSIGRLCQKKRLGSHLD